MARTMLFSRLQAFFTRASNRHPAREVDPERRALVQLGLLAPAVSLLPACGEHEPEAPRRPRVVVVGAGLAGLHCAYRLHEAGVSVHVYEAASRVGGRTFTARGEFPDEQIAELGGELIDSNHAAMWALADEFGLTLDDRAEPPAATGEIWWVGGAAVPEATVVAQFTAVAATILADLEAADSEDAEYERLDGIPLATYLDDVVPSSTFPELHAILTTAYRGEFGRETSEQSALNLVYLVGSDDPDPFRVFGESDERWHAHAGSDAFATALATRLGDAVVKEHRLTRLTRAGDGYRLALEVADGSTVERTADHVVLAIPFSVLRGVVLEVELSAEKRAIIDALGYGTNAKVMGAFRERVWRTRHDALGAVTSDREYQQIWDTSLGQPGAHGLLTNFLGGTTGEAVGDADVETWFVAVAAELEAVFPGLAAEYVAGSARRMHWPTSPFALGSYTCYLPGQWAFWGLEGVREGDVHFCGEHTSPDFQGWMEGAAETGAFAAAEILADLGIAPSPALAALLAEKLPQATWGLERSRRQVRPRRQPLARRRALSALRR